MTTHGDLCTQKLGKHYSLGHTSIAFAQLYRSVPDYQYQAGAIALVVLRNAISFVTVMNIH